MYSKSTLCDSGSPNLLTYLSMGRCCNRYHCLMEVTAVLQRHRLLQGIQFEKFCQGSPKSLATLANFGDSLIATGLANAKYIPRPVFQHLHHRHTVRVHHRKFAKACILRLQWQALARRSPAHASGRKPSPAQTRCLPCTLEASCGEASRRGCASGNILRYAQRPAFIQQWSSSGSVDLKEDLLESYCRSQVNVSGIAVLVKLGPCHSIRLQY